MGQSRYLFLLLGFLACSALAEPVKTIFNPFTGKQDYITRVDSNTLPSGSTQYIQNRSSVPGQEIFSVSSGSVSGQFKVNTGPLIVSTGTTGAIYVGDPNAPWVDAGSATLLMSDNGNAPGIELHSFNTVGTPYVDMYDSAGKDVLFGMGTSNGSMHSLQLFSTTPGSAIALDPNNTETVIVYSTGMVVNTLSASQCVQTDSSKKLISSGGACGGGGGGGSGYAVEPATVTFNLAQGVIASTVTVSSNTVLSGATFYQNGPAIISGITLNSNGIIDGQNTRLDVRSSMTVTDTGTTHNPNAGLIDIWKLNTFVGDPLFSIGTNDMNNQFVFKNYTAPFYSFGIEVASLKFGIANGDTIHDNNVGTSQGINFYANGGDIDIKTGFGAGDILLRPQNNDGFRVSVITGITASSSMTVISAGGILIRQSLSSTPPSNFIVNLSSANQSMVFGVQNSGHVISSGTVPTMGTCGTSPSVDGTDLEGVITVGSGVVTSCTINFASPYARAPVCVCSDNSTTVSCSNGTISTTAYTINTSATLGGGLLSYICMGNKG